MDFDLRRLPGRLHYQRSLHRLEKFAAKQVYALLARRSKTELLHAYAIASFALLLCRMQGRNSGIEAYLKAIELALTGLSELAKSDKDREVITKLRTMATELAVLPISEP